MQLRIDALRLAVEHASEHCCSSDTQCPEDQRRHRGSEPITRPDGARFQRGNQFVCETDLATQRTDASADTRRRTTEPAGFSGDQRRFDLFAITLAQGRAKVADAVDEPKLHSLLSSPVLPGEQSLAGAVQLGAAP